MSLWPTYNSTTTTNKAVDVKEAMRHAIRQLKLTPPAPVPSHLLIDPDTHRDLVRAFTDYTGGGRNVIDGDPFLCRIYGMAVVSRSIGRKWVPPTDRYVEYEESDHGWLRRMGFGRYAEFRYALFSNLRETWDASFTMREAGIWE